MNPRVSIVTTVYDRIDCLARCLRALAHSTFTDFEQIVVSDAPPSSVLGAIARLVAQAGPRVGHLNLPRRTNDWGRSPAIAGLAAARGAYVCFLSDDNAYLPDHFGPLVAALDADPDLGFAYASCQYAGRKELRTAPPAGARIDLGQPLFRRAVIEPGDLAFNEFAWDWRLIGSLLDRGIRWHHIDQPSFVFRLAAYPALVEALA